MTTICEHLITKITDNTHCLICPLFIGFNNVETCAMMLLSFTVMTLQCFVVVLFFMSTTQQEVQLSDSLSTHQCVH